MHARNPRSSIQVCRPFNAKLSNAPDQTKFSNRSLPSGATHHQCQILLTESIRQDTDNLNKEASTNLWMTTVQQSSNCICTADMRTVTNHLPVLNTATESRATGDLNLSWPELSATKANLLSAQASSSSRAAGRYGLGRT